MDQLYYGDNPDVLRHHNKDETVDLVYLDPPFNSKAVGRIQSDAKTRSQDDLVQVKETCWLRPSRFGGNPFTSLSVEEEQFIAELCDENTSRIGRTPWLNI